MFKSYPSLKSVLGEILPLHRTLASDDMDRTFDVIGSHMPASANYVIETYSPGKRVWTWRVPERYEVHEAYLEKASGEGGHIVDFADNPLHVISYSLPVDAILTWDELRPHLRYSEKRRSAIPWEFKYYERDWGFCLSKDQFDELPRDINYHVVIRSDFITNSEQGFRVATARVLPEDGPNPPAGEFLIMSHTCHPMQANDNVSGVVAEIELAHRFVENPLPAGSMGLRFWFGPETIGSIAYLAHHEELIPSLRGGLFLDSIGNQNSLALQHTRQGDHLLDRIAASVLRRHVDVFRQGEFAQIAPNDERVLNGPGVNVPCISLTRFPFPEYHTSDDNLDIIHENLLIQTVDVAEEIIRVFASNYIPRRTFRGPLFLGGNDLWVDERKNRELNQAAERITMSFDGCDTVFDISEAVDLDYWIVREYVEKCRNRGFVKCLPIPFEGEVA